MSTGGWALASLTWLLLLALVVLGIVALVHFLRLDATATSGASPPPSSAPGGPTPEEILRLRLARGEIEPDEYERRKAALRSGA